MASARSASSAVSATRNESANLQESLQSARSRLERRTAGSQKQSLVGPFVPVERSLLRHVAFSQSNARPSLTYIQERPSIFLIFSSAAHRSIAIARDRDLFLRLPGGGLQPPCARLTSGHAKGFMGVI